MKTHVLLTRFVNLKGLLRPDHLDQGLFILPSTDGSSGGDISEVLTVSTGWPLGCVLLSGVSSLFNNWICDKWLELYSMLIKNVNDMALVWLMKKQDTTGETLYLSQIKALESWCNQSKLNFWGSQDKRAHYIFETRFYSRTSCTYQPTFLNGGTL